MIAREYLDAAARVRRIDPVGLSDRELRLVLLAAEGIDIEAPSSFRDCTPIRNASDEQHDRRLGIVLTTSAPVPTGDLGVTAALNYLRREWRLNVALVDLTDALDRGELPHGVDAQGRTRIRVEDLDRVARRVGART